jgi:MoaA/NifB/PqqE/SkfB family radical SAM enzyme
MVEVEVFSFCNRRCWFCPNSTHDRHSRNIYMPEPLYLNILQQLASIEYDNIVSYSRYNEPLADRIILKRIEQARALLPRALLHTNTNGDYLTRAFLDDLYTAGLRSLSVQVYLGNNKPYEHDRVRGQMLRKIRDLGLAHEVTIDRPDDWLEARVIFRDMTMKIYGRNFDRNGCSRCQTVPIRTDYVRTSPCLSPFRHIYIDHNGKVVPCCNFRSDIPSHSGAVVGDTTQTATLFEIYAQSALVDWRRSLIGFEMKRGFCQSCSFGVIEETPENIDINQYLKEIADMLRLTT